MSLHLAKRAALAPLRLQVAQQHVLSAKQVFIPLGLQHLARLVCLEQ